MITVLVIVALLSLPWRVLISGHDGTAELSTERRGKVQLGRGKMQLGRGWSDRTH